jgi:hypothetical protein
MKGVGMAVIKTVGSSGQIALGKQYAGRHVLVEEMEPGIWLIKMGEFIPDSERWIHSPGFKEQLDGALAWAAQNPPSETDLNQLEKRVSHEPRARSRSTRI